GYERRPFERTRAGVFIGASVSEHKEFLLSRIRAMQLFDGAFGRALSGPEADNLRDALIEHVVPMRAFSMPGNLLNMAAAIVAQTWDLGGPALSVDAACSSALVATQQAIVNLRGGQIDLAIAGGVYLNLLPDNLVCFSRIGALSRRGECRPFDAGADGFVMGEGRRHPHGARKSQGEHRTHHVRVRHRGSDQDGSRAPPRKIAAATGCRRGKCEARAGSRAVLPAESRDAVGEERASAPRRRQ